MGSRLIDGIIYSDQNRVVLRRNSNIVDNICTYKLKSKYAMSGYICRTSRGCQNKLYKGELVCDYCGRRIEFRGRKGQIKVFDLK